MRSQLEVDTHTEMRQRLMMWFEATQALLSVLVVVGTMGLLLLRIAVPNEWWQITILVIGYFFGARSRVAGAGAAAGLLAVFAFTTLIWVAQL